MNLSLILLLVLIFFPALNYWVFEKAGVSGYKSLIPFYNYYVWLKILGKPMWWLIFLVIPFINVFMVLLLLVNTAVSFGRHDLVSQGLAAIVPVAYLPYLGLSKKEKYIRPEDKVRIKKSPARDWIDNIIFAVVAASIIRMFMMEAYTIPTPSMEKSLLVGDFLFVSKLSYGPKLPNTPLSFPFVHHTMPFTKYTKSYLEWIKWPYYRFPGFGNVKRGDAVVFNYPEGDTVALARQTESYYDQIKYLGRNEVWNNKFEFGDIVARPVDKRENYIKRCIGIAGDSIQIKNEVVYVNGQATEFPKKSQFMYLIKTNGDPISKRLLDKLDITEKIQTTQAGDPVLVLTQESAEKLRTFPNIVSVEKFIQPNSFDQGLFPRDTMYKWNVDNYGPVYIPKKGATVQLTLQTLPFYYRVIQTYEHNKLEVKDGKIFINDAPAASYTFKMNYYWMMGDNRHNSADSRFWGFVPEDHIVGKAVFVWISLDNNKPLFGGKIRWSKMFRVVK